MILSIDNNIASITSSLDMLTHLTKDFQEFKEENEKANNNHNSVKANYTIHQFVNEYFK